MQRNKLILIAVMTTLLLIKFVLLPLQQKQQDLHQELTVVSKQLQRSKALVEQELQKLLQSFPEVVSTSQYRLALQQQFQKLALDNAVSVTFFDWLTDTPLDAFNIHRGRVSLRVDGNASKVMQLHLMLEQFPHFSLRDIRASWRGDLSRDRRIELNLLIEVDYRLPEAV